MGDDDVPSAILTKSQREYVRGEGEPSNEYMMRSRIRKRVFAALRYDGMILGIDGLDPELRREIFREWENQNYESDSNGVKIPKDEATLPDGAQKGQFKFGLEGLLQFLYLGIEESEVGSFWEILYDAIDQALREHGKHVKKFEPNIEFGELASLRDVHRMLEAGELEYEDLTLGEVIALIQSGLMDLEDFPVSYLKTVTRSMEVMTDAENPLETLALMDQSPDMNIEELEPHLPDRRM